MLRMLVISALFGIMMPRPVFINGKPLGNAQVIEGRLVIAVDDFEKAFVDEMIQQTAENNSLRRDGTVVTGHVPMQAQVAHPLEPSSLLNTAGGTTAQKRAPLHHASFRVVRNGQISSHAFSENGKWYLPLGDVVRAFGGTFNDQAKPPDSPTLNFAVNGNGILGFN